MFLFENGIASPDPDNLFSNDTRLIKQSYKTDESKFFKISQLIGVT